MHSGNYSNYFNIGSQERKFKMINLIIPGEPKGKQRPRVCKSGHAYTPQQTVLYENYVKFLYKSENLPFMDGEIEAVIKIYYSIPKSSSKSKRISMENNLIRPTKKPDCDNVAKIILDSLNGVAYKDDSQIVSLRVEKFYGEPRVELRLSNDLKIKGDKVE